MNELFKKWQKILRLEDWDITIVDDMTIDGDGESFIKYNMNAAQISLKPQLSHEEKEKTLIHELLHLVHRDECDLVSDNIKGYNSTLYTRFHERNIDKMALLLYENLK